MTRAPYLSARLQGFGTTVFAEMSALAVATGSINLGQGFPDYEGPEPVIRAAADARRDHGETVMFVVIDGAVVGMVSVAAKPHVGQVMVDSSVNMSMRLSAARS